MTIIPTRHPKLARLQPKVFADRQGFFYESHNEQTINKLLGKPIMFAQDNHSRSSKNVICGLHFQHHPHEQEKPVRCTTGEIYDVAVDIYPNSPHLGKWEAFRLSADNKLQLWIPLGFTHGLLILSETWELQYKTADFYNSVFEGCTHWSDPLLAIDWPLNSGAHHFRQRQIGQRFEQVMVSIIDS